MGPPDTERAYSEFDVGFFLFDGRVKTLDEPVDVVAPPLGDAHPSAFGSIGIVSGGVVKNDLSALGVGVEVERWRLEIGVFLADPGEDSSVRARRGRSGGVDARRGRRRRAFARAWAFVRG